MAVYVLAVYVLAVFLSRMDDDSGHDYASDSEYLSFIFSMPFWNLFSIFNHSNECFFKCRPRVKAKI